MGGKETTILRMVKLSGDPIPDRIKNKPKLNDGLFLYYRGFSDLRGSDRIQWREILEYCNYHGLSKEQTDKAFILIRALDDCYHEWVSKQK